MKLLNLALFTPQNVVAIGAIIFFWGACMYFGRELVAVGNSASAE